MQRLLAGLVATLTLTGQEPDFRTNVPVVLVPVTVTDKTGNFVDGLNSNDFAVSDQDRRQVIHMDAESSTYTPLAVVVAVQANDLATAADLKIQKIGSILQPLIIGTQGHAAIISFGGRITQIQDFTGDGNELESSLHALQPQPGRSARMLDAVAEGIRLLGERPKNEHRVLIVIGESKDRGSESKLRDIVESVERNGITVFSVVFSAWLTPFTAKAGELPPPTADTDLLAGLSEIGRLRKNNTADTLAEASGGRKLSFVTLAALEKDLSRIGAELHSQYVLSFPAATDGSGFHRIKVEVSGHPELIIHSRPGYWAGGR